MFMSTVDTSRPFYNTHGEREKENVFMFIFSFCLFFFCCC